MTRIAVVGSINMDLITTASRLPRPGETVLGTAHSAAPGGKGANQAIAAARVGAQVHMIGAVGSDDYGRALREHLDRHSVSTSNVRTVLGPSGIAAISVDEAGENSIIVVGGANRQVTALSADDLRIIAQSEVLLCQLEVPLPTVAAAITHARNVGVLVILNLSPVQELPPRILACVDVLVLNRAEREQLGGSAVGGTRHVVTTLGAEGARYQSPGGVDVVVPAPKVQAVDTTGAGDTFTGALAATWRHDPLSALRWGCAAGALAATQPGAHAPSAADISALVQA